MLSFDGTSGSVNVSGNTITLPITTTLANDVLVVWVALEGGDSVASVLSSSGLNWALRHADANVAIYSALKPAAGLETITVSLNYAGGNFGCAFAIGGANTTSPWDSDGSLPVWTPGTDVTNTAIYSTDYPDDFVFFVSYVNSAGYTLPAGFTAMFTAAPGLCAGYQIVSAVQSGAQVSVFGYPSFISLDVIAGMPVGVGGSQYGKGPYGFRLYSRISYVDFSGNLTPLVGLSGAIDILVAQGDLAGDLRPVIVLRGSLAVDRLFAGNMTSSIVLAASGVFGPYWPPSEPCPSPPWDSSEPCPPSLWTPTGPCVPVDWEESVDG